MPLVVVVAVALVGAAVHACIVEMPSDGISRDEANFKPINEDLTEVVVRWEQWHAVLELLLKDANV